MSKENEPNKGKSKLGRTALVNMTPEAHVLKMLRERAGMSMRELGKQLGYSDSYVSQVENGRSDPPHGEKLNHWLKPFNSITNKYFAELCRDWIKETTEHEALVELSSKLSPRDLGIVLSLTRLMLSEEVQKKAKS